MGDEKGEEIREQLREVLEKQFKTQQSLKKHERLEQDVHELNVISKRLIDEIREFWQKDYSVLSELEQYNIKLLHHEHRVRFGFNNYKEKLLKEKRHLYDAEGQLYNKQRLQMREEGK